MSRRGHVRWLETQLPEWTARGWIGADGSEQIRRHYAPDRGAGRSWLRMLLAIIGAVLIGGGIILILAHNWSDLSRPARAAVAFAVLLLGQAVAASAVRRPETSTGTREASAAFAALTVGAALAIIGQTYHWHGGSAFTLTWMLLILPLIYTHYAVTPALFYIAGICVWAVLERERTGPIAYLPLLALIAPHLAERIRRGGAGTPVVALMLWVIAAGAAICFGAFSDEDIHSAPVPLRPSFPFVMPHLFALYALLDALFFERAPTLGHRPLKFLGVGGVVVLLFIFSFRDPALELAGLRYFEPAGYSVAGFLLAGLLPILWLGALTAVATRVFAGAGEKDSEARKRPFRAVLGYGLAPLFLTVVPHLVGPATWLAVNAWLLALGVWTLADGARERSLGRVNGGMLLIAALILARFFDSDLTFLSKGIAFIVVGVAFLAANLALAKRRKGGAA